MGIIERRTRDRQRRIMEILTSAKHIFHAKGFLDSTMNDIASDSDLSRRTLYLYFHNKEEILLTIAVNTLERLSKDVIDHSESNQKGIDHLMDLARSYRNLFLADEGNFQFLPNFTNCLRAVGPENEIVIKCETTIDNLAKMVTEYLIQGMEDGSVRQLDDPKRTAAILISMLHSFVQSMETDTELLPLTLHISPAEFIDESLTAIKQYLSPTTKLATP